MPSAVRDNITILHLSDLQFGKHHQFGRFTEAADGSMNTLLQRLGDDLDALAKSEGLKPDLIALGYTVLDLKLS